MKKVFSAYEKIKACADEEIKLYIRGAGLLGRNLFIELQELGINADAFLDANHLSLNPLLGVPVLPPDSIYNLPISSFFVLVAIKDDVVYYEIEKEMASHGLKLGEDFADFSIDADQRMKDFSDIKYEYDVRSKFSKISDYRISEMTAVIPSFQAPATDIFNLIPNLDLPLTTYCSLKCKYCSHCIPSTNPPRHFSVEDTLNDLDKLLSVSYATCVAIMGGEPFVYPGLTEFLKNYTLLKNFKNIGFTRIVTNGTILPKDEVLSAFRQVPNSYLYISNYGDKSMKIDLLAEKCKEFGIPYYICPNTDWTALGEYSYSREYSEEQLKHLYAVCDSHSCIQLFNGHLYACGRTPILNEDGLIPFSKSDFIDIRKTEQENLSEQLHQYLYETLYLNGCKYCDGQHEYSRRVGRGE